jgi:hypothetical protein
VFFPAAFAFFHLALAAAAIFARTAALIFQLGLLAGAANVLPLPSGLFEPAIRARPAAEQGGGGAIAAGLFWRLADLGLLSILALGTGDTAGRLLSEKCSPSEIPLTNAF